MPLTRDDYATLEIKHAIFHDLPRQTSKSATEIAPLLSEAVTSLVEAARQHIRSKLVDTLQSINSYGVQFGKEDSVVSTSVRQFLNRRSYDEADYIDRSRAFAKDLFERQGPLMSAGLLCVVSCSVNSRSAIGLMKIEREEGAQLNLAGDVGHRTFEFALLNNLVFTRNTKLYKAGLFAKLGPEADSIGAVASDHQFGNVMAQYWLDFLGCRKELEPRVETERFFETIIQAINKHKTLTPLQKHETYEALLVEMRSKRGSINTSQFVRDHIPQAAQDVVRGKLRETGIANHFDKDTSDIKSSIARKVLRTKNDIKVIVPEKVDDLVKISKESLTVLDPLVRVGTD